MKYKVQILRTKGSKVIFLRWLTKGGAMEEKTINEGMSENVEIAIEDDISLKTLTEMDNAIKNLKCGLVSSGIDLSD